MTTLALTPPPTIRPIDETDCTALTAFYAGLSPDSREARFHGAAAGIGGGTARYLCGPDHGHREGFVAETMDGGDGQDRPVIVGHVCIEPIGPGEAEMAIAVADAWHRHGVGRRLLAESIGWAGEHGIVRLIASVRLGNSAILGLIGSVDRVVTVGGCDGGEIDVTIDLGDPNGRPLAA